MQLCGLTGVRQQSALPPSMKGELLEAGCCGGFVAQQLWQLQPDTLGASTSADSFSFFSFLSIAG